MKSKKIGNTEKCCFACDRKFNSNTSRTRPVIAYTTDGQLVYVGADCFERINYWDDRGGYQPAKGGPRLRSYAPSTPEWRDLRVENSKLESSLQRMAQALTMSNEACKSAQRAIEDQGCDCGADEPGTCALCLLNSAIKVSDRLIEQTAAE